MLTVERQAGSDACLIRLSGDIDSVTVPLVREAIETALAEGCRTIVLDLAEVDYLDSSALGLVVWADHRLQPNAGTLTLAGAGRDVARILELSGLIGVAPSVFLADSVEAAMGGLMPPRGGGEPLWTQEFEVPGEVRVLAEARSRIAAIVAPLGIPDSAIFDIKVAVGEALANAVRHGSPEGPADLIGIQVRAYEDRVEVLVSDRGPGFDGATSSSTDPYAPGGRGVLFMRALMDLVEFQRLPGAGTRVRLAKRLSPAEESAD